MPGRDGADVIRCSITDEGIGIPPERLGRLFSSFSQVDASTSRRYGGTGLGLAISKALCTLMGGEIGVESQPGEGSTFWFTLRMTVASAGTGEIQEGLADKRLLVVDDVPTNRLILDRVLAAAGARVVVAEGAARALELLREARDAGEPYELALLDHQMPVISGLELAALIRKEPGLGNLPLLMLSSINRQATSAQLAELGIVGWAQKPVWRSQLLPMVARALGAGVGSSIETLADIGRCCRRLWTSCAARASSSPRTTKSISWSPGQLLKKWAVPSNWPATASTAVEAACRWPFDLILMDCQMPQMDGYEATQKNPDSRIRRPIATCTHALSGRSRIPILALTASALKGDCERCLEAGMDDYQSKPLNLQRLFAVIARWLNACPRRAAFRRRRTPSLPECRCPTRQEDAAVDEDLLAELCMGDRSLADMLLVTLSEKLSGYVDSIRQSLVGGDGPAMAAASHRLKGAASNVGAVALADSGKQLEGLARAGELSGAAGLLDQLDNRANAFRDYVARRRAEPRAGAA